ncbi:hypothetical protein CTI12_AA187450 [Artemisia annua]|uniref:Uncharacterized protein n=1 Tax=Artemisia annua TaxID=35608 RepID=A0A2U1P6S8_ARTAN|nr:hypothetical protein CTI12_AA187450 [Artemisia annua]
MDVNYVPLKIKVSLDDQMLMVRNATDYCECIEEYVDIEKGNSETPKYASFLGKFKKSLQKQISVEMRGNKCVQLLMNHSLPKFSIQDNTTAGKVIETPRMRKYKHIGSFNPRKVALVFSAMSTFGTIILIFLTLRSSSTDW